MGQKIVIGCYEIPGYGGASTSSYALFQMMKQDGMNVSYVNLINEIDVDYFQYAFGEHPGNPKCLDHVHNCVLHEPLWNPHPQLAELLSKLSPDLMIGVTFIAALLMKRALAQRPMIFLASNCGQAGDYVVNKRQRDAISLMKFMRSAKNKFELPNIHEGEAVEISDLIIANSDMALFFLQHFFPSKNGKILPDPIWSAEWTRKDALEYTRLQRPFDSREIDVLFVASIWSRPEKNYELVKKIVSRCQGLNIHIVGEVEQKDTLATYHGLVTRREELFSLFGRAKTVVSTSCIDSAPGTLIQAAVMGCNIVASKNCGNWRLCHEDLLVDPYHVDKFIEKIQYGLSKKYVDNMDRLLGTESFKNLKQIVEVF